MTTETTAAPAGETSSTPAVAATPDSSTAPAATTEASTTEVKPAEATPAATEAPKEAPKTDEPPAKPERVAPDKYEFKAPEGSQLDPSVMGKFEAVAKELGMPQDEAQKFVDAVGPQLVQAQLEAHKAVITQWTADAKADKEFGGDKLDANLAVAKKALDTFGTPELTKLLNETGLGNNPEIIRAFYRAGTKISSSEFVTGGKAPTSQNGTAANKLYPDMP